MNQLKEKALTLRLKGYSYNEINKTLNIPKATLSGWFSNLILPLEAQRRIAARISQGVMNGLLKHNKRQTVLARKRAGQIRHDARKEISPFTKKDLLLVGIILYWAEGYKRIKVVNGREVTNHMVSFTNSDPLMIKTFVSFARDNMGINPAKIRVQLRLFKHINEQSAIAYWSKISGLPKESFGKASYVISRSSLGKRPFKRLPFGTVQVRICDTRQFHRLMGWIEGTKIRLADLFKNN